MPSWASVIRLLRRRLVLGIIFALSLTYCAISLLAHEKLGPSLRKNDLQEADDNMLPDNNEDLAVEDDADDDIFKGSGKHLAWQLELENYDSGNLDSENVRSSTDSNGTLIVARTCRNSVQGKALIVDERGFVCARSEVLPTGCCTTVVETTKDEANVDRLSAKKRRYSCETCNPQGCCAIYEYCVSCCLQSGKKRGKKDAKNGAGEKERRESPKSRRGDDAIKVRLRNLDRFQICLAACRTSSASVRHENTYKDPDSKHCYSHYQRNRRDDQISNNNNEDNAAVVVTSSSTLSLLIPSLHHPAELSHFLTLSFSLPREIIVLFNTKRSIVTNEFASFFVIDRVVANRSKTRRNLLSQ